MFKIDCILFIIKWTEFFTNNSDDFYFIVSMI